MMQRTRHGSAKGKSAEMHPEAAKRVFAEPTKVVEPGTYRHFTGELFTVLLTGLDTVTKQECVVYKPLDVDECIYVAPLNKFLAAVEMAGRREVPRFERVR